MFKTVQRADKAMPTWSKTLVMTWTIRYDVDTI